MFYSDDEAAPAETAPAQCTHGRCRGGRAPETGLPAGEITDREGDVMGEDFSAGPPRPGIVALQELRVGGIVTAGARFVRANPVTVVIPAALWSLLLLAVSGAAGWVYAATAPAPESTMSPESALLTVGVVVLALVVTPPATALVLSTLRPAVLGQARVTMGQAWTSARPRLRALYGVWLVVTVISLIPLLVELGFSAPLHGAPETPTGAAVVGGLLLMASYLLLIYVSVLIAFAPAVVVIEGKTSRAALRRSVELVRGAWWRCLGVLASISLITAVVMALVAVPVIGIAVLIGLVAPMWLAMLVGGVLLSGVVAVNFGYATGAAALLYQDQRIRRENYAADLLRDAQLDN